MNSYCITWGFLGELHFLEPPFYSMMSFIQCLLALLSFEINAAILLNFLVLNLIE